MRLNAPIAVLPRCLGLSWSREVRAGAGSPCRARAGHRAMQLPMQPPAPQPRPSTDILAELSRPRPEPVAASEPRAPAPEMSAEERDAIMDGLLAEILENPEAAFRADAELFQDFLVRCRIRRVPGAPLSLSAFRRKMAVARSGVDAETAATEAWRGRVANIDNYIVKATTNVNFDTGKADLSEQAKADLCAAAAQAQTMNNSLLLVLGYTDSTGSDDVNQALSEKRAAKVVNYLQQKCGWKPYRMLTPTGMATADPAASNATPEARRRTAGSRST